MTIYPPNNFAHSDQYNEDYLDEIIPEDINIPTEILRLTHRLAPDPEQGGQAILFTSVQPQEGKSSILQHLAIACGTLLDLSILISDLHPNDRTRPFLSSPDLMAFGSGIIVGVPPHLQGSGFVEDADELHSAMSIEPTTHPHIKRLDIFQSHSHTYKFLKANLPFYRSEYRLILVEAPALHGDQKPDPVLLSQLFDQTIVVIQPHRTNTEQVQETLTLLKQSGTKRLSVLINRGPESASNQFSLRMFNSPLLSKMLEIPIFRNLISLLQKISRRSPQAEISRDDDATKNMLIQQFKEYHKNRMLPPHQDRNFGP
jgi:hypothetical protein